VLEAGDHVPEAAVYRGPGERTTFAELCADGPILVFFYLFDWSST
jgi:hypothetical protein